jgi:beta-lactamase regulating signal transducer with metallopeptidase domain
MNLVEALLSQPLVTALGWALIHFVWQGALVALLLAGVLAVMQRRSANARYAVACAAMLLTLLLPLATMVIVGLSSPGKRATAPTPTVAAPRESSLIVESRTVDARSSTSIEAASPGSWLVGFSDRLVPLLPWMIAVWLLGVVIFSLRLAYGWLYAQRVRTYGTRPLDETWQQALERLCRRLRVMRPVRLLESAFVKVPTAIGWLRPIILLPAGAVIGLTPQQLEAILAHELAHIRRHDYLINLLQAVIETLLFYHPAVWWVSGRIREEREHCCDDLAVGVCGDAFAYARALIEMEQLRAARPQLAVAADGGHLMDRIRRLIGVQPQHTNRFTGLVAGIVVMTAVVSVGVGAQILLPSSDVSTDERVVSVSKQEAKESSDDAESAASSRSTEVADQNQTPRSAQEDRAAKALVPAGGALEKPVEEEAMVTPDPMRIEPKGGPAFSHQQRDAQTDPQDFIGEMQALGYTNLSVDDLITLRRRGVTAEFVREMNTLLNRRLSVSQLTAFKTHGITPRFISELRTAGYDDLSADDLTAFRIHGVTPQFISEWKRIGYDNLSAEALTAFRIHGVTPALVQAMKDLGYDRLSPDDLAALRIHGVNPTFVETMRAAIRGKLSINDLTGLRIHGVTVEFVEEIEKLGYGSLSADQLMSLRIHGVTPRFVQAIQALGYKPTVDQLTSLRIHGVTPDFIEAVKNRGFHDVTMAQLIELRRLNIVPGSRRK